MELYRALESSVEAHKAVLAAHPMYANLMERALAKVVLQHVTTLEKFCQVPQQVAPPLLAVSEAPDYSSGCCQLLLVLMCDCQHDDEDNPMVMGVHHSKMYQPCTDAASQSFIG